jgi:hypothetical protein
MMPGLRTRLLSVMCASVLVAGCGGGDSAPTAAAPVPASVAGSAAASLVISLGSPASINGTLDKTLVAGANEAGISNATGTFSGAGPNDYCRVAVYAMTDSGDGKKYDLEVVFAKSDKKVSFTGLSLNGAALTFSARASGTLPGTSVDTANRRVTFANTVLGVAGGNMATLNGSLEYSTNGSLPDRAACG